MPTKFTVDIEMGNDLMQTPAHVGAALQQVAFRLDELTGSGRWPGTIAVYDENGNKVGQAYFTTVTR